MSGPFSRVVEAVALIASKLGATVTSSGNRLADNLEGIAEAVSGGGGGSGGDFFFIRYNSGESEFSCTFSEMQQAVRDGKILVLVNMFYAGEACMNCSTELLFDEAEPYATFAQIYTDNFGGVWGKYAVLKPDHYGSGKIEGTLGDLTFSN